MPHNLIPARPRQPPRFSRERDHSSRNVLLELLPPSVPFGRSFRHASPYVLTCLSLKARSRPYKPSFPIAPQPPPDAPHTLRTGQSTLVQPPHHHHNSNKGSWFRHRTFATPLQHSPHQAANVILLSVIPCSYIYLFAPYSLPFDGVSREDRRLCPVHIGYRPYRQMRFAPLNRGTIIAISPQCRMRKCQEKRLLNNR